MVNMRCKQIQGLLKSDYLDGEAGQREERQIKEHLAHCPDCRGVEKELQAQRMLFQKAEQQPVPERVWQNVRDVIVTERLNQESGANRGIIRQLKESTMVPRPVFVLAGALTVIILVLALSGTFIQKNQSLSKVNIAESIVGYSLNGESGDFSYDLGTNIEEYFL